MYLFAIQTEIVTSKLNAERVRVKSPVGIGSQLDIGRLCNRKIVQTYTANFSITVGVSDKIARDLSAPKVHGV